MVAPSTTAKRKKTADMAESPPKRVTRARAKATEDTESTTKTTKITTAAAKAAAETKALTNSSKITKRKTRADDEHEQIGEIPGPSEDPVTVPVKTRGRPKKQIDAIKTEGIVGKAQIRTKGRQEKDVSITDPAQPERPKTRARPKKETNAGTAEAQEVVAEDGKRGIEKKSARGRSATATSKSTRTTGPKASTTKKKVTFQVESEQDKENCPVVPEQPTKAGPKPTGLRAKPVRKTAQTRTGTRAKGVTKGEVTDTGEKEETRPLSPKKVKQVAKTSSVSSEDELCGEKTPVRALSKSPTKPSMSIMRSSVKPMSKLDFSAATAPLSPTKNVSSSILTSPARRRPPSPFKDALKESPRRINLGKTMAQPVLEPSQSSMKVSLLQSPARRPPLSPMKVAVPGSSGKSAVSVPVIDATTPTTKANAFRKPMFSPQKTISSPLRAARSPEQSVKVHKMTLTEQEELASQAESPLINQSVVSKGIKEMTPHRTVAPNISRISVKTPKPELMLQSPSTSPIEETEEAGDIVDHAAAEEHNINSAISTRSTTPSGPPPPSVMKTFSMLSPAWRSSIEDSESEDELQSPQKDDTPTPLVHFNIATKDFGTRGLSTPTFPDKAPESMMRETGANGGPLTAAESQSRAAQKSVVSMTPLAAQLSSWLAASPEKKTPANERRQPRGIFSHVGPTLLNRSEQKVEDTPVPSPIKTTFFEDEMAVREEQNEAESEDRFEEGDESRLDLQPSQESQGSEEYGDENVMPLEPELLGMEQKPQDFTLTCTPAKIFSKQPREIHTVSKVPLRPAAADSPLKIPRNRSKSLSGGLGLGRDSPREGATARNQPKERMGDEYGIPSRLTLAAPQIPGSGMCSIAGTPAKGNRQGADAEILKGAVVYVDVHTTEGADASGIFLELLTQMGARCVKQWTWNPRASFGGSLEGAVPGQAGSSHAGQESATSGSKIGITHVVFKDGGKRTLEKVRESKGVVLCVGVGWVLE